MTRLERKAWLELVGITALVMISSICLFVMVRLNAQGVEMLAIGLAAGLVTGVFAAVQSVSSTRQYDERELKIYMQAFMWSAYAFTVLFAFAAFAIFFLVGGNGSVPVYALPGLFLASLFVAQVVQSGTILVRLAREQEDE